MNVPMFCICGGPVSQFHNCARCGRSLREVVEGAEALSADLEETPLVAGGERSTFYAVVAITCLGAVALACMVAGVVHAMNGSFR